MGGVVVGRVVVVVVVVVVVDIGLCVCFCPLEEYRFLISSTAAFISGSRNSLSTNCGEPLSSSSLSLPAKNCCSCSSTEFARYLLLPFKLKPKPEDVVEDVEAEPDKAEFK